MKTVERLLTMFIAVTLALSVLSVANPLFFTGGLTAFADEDEEDNDNSGSGSGSDEEEHEDSDEQDEEEQEEIDNDADEEEKQEEKKNKVIRSLGNKSKVTLETNHEVELEVEIEDGDLSDGTYNVTFACTSPKVHEEFASALEVEDEEGEFETELALANGTYAGCEVVVGGLSAAFPSFTVVLEEEDKEDEEHEEEQESKIKLEVEDNGIEIEVELKGITMTDGLYDVIFSCTEPAISENFTGAFEVEDGEGEFEAEISLSNATYNGCQLTVQDIVIPFDSFIVMGEVEEEVEEKRKERRHSIVNSITGAEIHQRHLNAQPASTGDYQAGWNYTVMAVGIAEGDDDILANAAASIDLAVWKSNSAVILLDVTGGQVEIGDQSYTVAIGYALYAIHSDILRINALVIDDATGDVLKLKMRGSPLAENAEFPMDTGSLELEFEGNSGPSKNELNGWELMLEGTVAAV